MSEPSQGKVEVNRLHNEHLQGAKVDLPRLEAALDQVAILINDGEEWMLPHFERIFEAKQDLEKRDEKREFIRVIAEKARAKKLSK